MPQPNVPGVDPQLQAQCDGFRHDYRAVQAEIGKAIVGHEEIVDGVLTCLFVGGHALLEGVPGLGKTALIRSLAQALNLKFARIQFTPDLMPADVNGTNVIMENQSRHREFTFVHGPIFAQIVLADEINRATHPQGQFAIPMVIQFLRVGVSPRAAQAITLGSKVRALLDGRFHVSFKDIKEVAVPAMRHRVILNFEGEAEGITSDMVLEKVVAETPTAVQEEVVAGRAS